MSAIADKYINVPDMMRWLRAKELDYASRQTSKGRKYLYVEWPETFVVYLDDGTGVKEVMRSLNAETAVAAFNEIQ